MAWNSICDIYKERKSIVIEEYGTRFTVEKVIMKV
jgi:hypothetical protein